MALPLEVAGSIPSRDELSRGQKKIPLAVLAARLGPLGHGPGFGGVFRGRVKPCCFLLMKNGGVRSPPHPPAAFFFLGMENMLVKSLHYLTQQENKMFTKYYLFT